MDAGLRPARAVRAPRRLRPVVRLGRQQAQPASRAAQVLSIKKWSPMKLMDDNKTVSGTNMGHLFARLDLLAPQFAALMEMYGKGELRRTSTAPSRSPRPRPRISTSTTARRRARCCWCPEARSGNGGHQGARVSCTCSCSGRRGRRCIRRPDDNSTGSSTASRRARSWPGRWRCRRRFCTPRPL